MMIMRFLFKTIILIAFVFIFSTQNVHSQDQGLTTVQIYVFNSHGQSSAEISKVDRYNKGLSKEVVGKKETILYCKFSDKDKLIKRYENLRKGLSAGLSAIDIAQDNNFIQATNGLIELQDALPGDYILVTDQEAAESYETIQITAGQKYYSKILRVNRLDEVPVNAQKKRRTKGDGGGKSTDKTELFRIQIFLEKGLAKETSRLIIQPYAILLETRDTIDYLEPIVYEGPSYHETQNRRMDFDFVNKDSLGRYYNTSTLLTHNEEVYIDTTIVYNKRPQHYGKPFMGGAHSFTLEDYHHEYYSMSFPGRYPTTPLKFVDFAEAMDTLRIEDFHIDRQPKTITQDKKLNLRFEREGSVKLADDSVNIIEKEKLLRELSLYESLLTEVEIFAGASPEGSDAINVKLAQKRAEVARNLIGYGARPKPKIYTWRDVYDEMVEQKKLDEAQQLKAIIDSHRTDDSMDGDIKKLPFYEEMIVPILKEMRSISCSYTYAETRPEEPYETKENFEKAKRDGTLEKYWANLPISGWYNLYVVADAEDQDLVTEKAYKTLSKRKDFLEKDFSNYVANRMAILNNKRNMPDSMVLKPFLDDTLQLNTRRNVGDEVIKLNLKEMVVNQTLTYMKLNDDAQVKNYVDWLQGDSAYNSKPENKEKLTAVLSTFFFKQYYPREGSLNDEEQKTYDDAKEFLMRQKDNRAVLYTEMDDWGKTKDAEPLVDEMDDDNPKKWYLKALLTLYKTKTDNKNDIPFVVDGASLKSSSRVVPGFEDFKVLSDKELEDLQKNDLEAYNNYYPRLDAYEAALKKLEEEQPSKTIEAPSRIPHYLAYFQHSFDMQPQFLKYYLQEGHVTDEQRRLFKYKLKYQDAYRALFNKLQQEAEMKETKPEGEKEKMKDENTETLETPETPEDANASEAPTENEENKEQTDNTDEDNSQDE